MNVALDLHSARLYLLVAPHPEVDQLCDTLIARLALAGAVRVLDGGNRFDAHQIARYIRKSICAAGGYPGANFHRQGVHLLPDGRLLAEQEAGKSPLLVLNLLTTFHDENVPMSERTRLLHLCIADLKRLADQSPVLVSATPAATPDGANSWNA